MNHLALFGLVSFNPRAREGRDLSRSAAQDYAYAFQSTRPRGARLAVFGQRLGNVPVSIHAPARGATSIPPTSDILKPGFNPRAREGRDA